MTEKQALREYWPDELAEAESIDWEALAKEIGTITTFYELPTSPEGREGPWLDKLELSQEAARHVRDGGTIDTDRVVLS